MFVFVMIQFEIEFEYLRNLVLHFLVLCLIIMIGYSIFYVLMIIYIRLSNFKTFPIKINV